MAELTPTQRGLGMGGTSGAGRNGPRYKGVPLRKCPITGFWFHADEALWRDGSWVSPEAYDELGRGEVDRTTPVLDHLMKKPRRNRAALRQMRK